MNMVKGRNDEGVKTCEALDHGQACGVVQLFGVLGRGVWGRVATKVLGIWKNKNIIYT